MKTPDEILKKIKELHDANELLIKTAPPTHSKVNVMNKCTDRVDALLWVLDGKELGS